MQKRRPQSRGLPTNLYDPFQSFRSTPFTIAPVGNEDRSRGLSGCADRHPAPKRRQANWPQRVLELGSLLWPSRESPADLSGAWSSIAAARPAAVKARTVPFPRSAHSRILLATYRRASCPSVPPGRNLHALSSASSILTRIRGPKPSVSMTTPSVSDGLNYIGQIENEKKEKKNPPGVTRFILPLNWSMAISRSCPQRPPA
jgi:hypothetical protein